MSSLTGYNAVAGTYGGDLTSGAALTCANNYILDVKIYVPSGQTLTIQPGTVIKGMLKAVPAESVALVVSRGGKIIASGTESCPIVFTAQADGMNGNYSLSNMGKWGGLVLLGRATNNLTLAANGPFNAGSGDKKMAVGDGLGVVEGFAASTVQDRFGVLQSGTVAGETIGAFDDNDNSGILRYVSVRHAGAILSVGSEINGITLGSVGRGTTIEHIEVVSCADDNIELFGGTVNLKYVTTLFGNDDMYDYDLGWSGKAQFLFGMKSDLTSSPDNDNGFEADSDDQKSNNIPQSKPKFYNVTLIGNAKATGSSDNTGLAGIQAKELAGGEFYNSIFARFRNGLDLTQALGAGRTYASGGESWHNWTNSPSTPSTPTATAGNGTQILKVKCNTFVGVDNPLSIGASKTSPGTNITSGADFTQFTTTDMNQIVATLPGFDFNFTANTTTNAFTVNNDVVPNPAVSTTGCPTVPVDGFFEPANYRGAFSSVPSENWLSNWTYSALIDTTNGLDGCPTDLNGDGVTDVNDFIIFAPAFGTSCN
jgi:hypothetical protein